jgi:Holliday junction DNA helicase RuvA
MISCLSGMLIEKNPPEIIIDVNGIGYELFAPTSTIYQLPNVNETIRLYTHLVVREDALTLYGFYSTAERTLFRALIKVNSVGPKLALTILSNIDLSDFIESIQSDNVKKLSSIKGLGPKTAKRLIVEMRDVILKSDFTLSSPTKDAGQATALMANDVMKDALSGLVGLGYKSHQAKQVLQMVYQPDMSSETLIRLALQQMA